MARGQILVEGRGKSQGTWARHDTVAEGVPTIQVNDVSIDEDSGLCRRYPLFFNQCLTDPKFPGGEDCCQK